MRIYKYIDMNDYFIHNILRREKSARRYIDDYINMIVYM